MRYVTAVVHPDHDTIAKFRRENCEAVTESFLQVLLLAKELQLLRLGTVSVDGTKLDAAASKHRFTGTRSCASPSRCCATGCRTGIPR